MNTMLRERRGRHKKGFRNLQVLSEYWTCIRVHCIYFLRSFISLSCKSESAKNVMTISEFMKFVDGQRDPRLNEILFPFCNSEKAQELIAKYEPNQFNVKVSKCQASGKIFFLLVLENFISVLWFVNVNFRPRD